MLRALFCLIVMPLPSILRTRLLALLPGYRIEPGARVGFAFVCVPRLSMGRGASIGALTIARHVEIVLGAHAAIGRGCWITGYPRNGTGSFSHVTTRDPRLIIGDHACITHRHVVDCTDLVEIGQFTTVAGWGSQLVTHGIDYVACRQHCQPIRIGSYCIVGTASVILGGAVVPERCVVGAKALVGKDLGNPGWLYAGVPARPVKKLDPGAAYFSRATGEVV